MYTTITILSLLVYLMIGFLLLFLLCDIKDCIWYKLVVLLAWPLIIVGATLTLLVLTIPIIIYRIKRKNKNK